VADDGFFLVWSVPDATVVRECYPVAATDLGEPFLVGGVVTEVVAVAFNGQSGESQDFWKPQPEVAVGEVDIQAARSKTTATSTASVVNS